MNIISKIIRKTLKWRSRKKIYKRYRNQFKHFLQLRGFNPEETVPCEDEYIAKWSQITKRVEPYSYRFFFHYCGRDSNIIPEDIGHVFVESVLNPVKYRSVYEDKNLYPRLLGNDNIPRTVLCRINGSCLLHADYQLADNDLHAYWGG